MMSWGLRGENKMNWEKIKNDFTHEKPTSYYKITGNEYFGRWVACEKAGFVKDGKITQLGYETYLTILTVMGVSSIYGSPKRKQRTMSQYDYLIKNELIVFNIISKKFEFGNDMPGFFTVLIKAMEGNSIPKI